ncbi:MAG TPA: MBOAT family O-acyltransferase [Tepidisphaeraceae bacterium]|jgi:D-alanyl-lipoteichoic acid acyltransferase DltB (MBOAT superfamily)|nr:MBOAT family O-acyltransferase [Tepidisphaeraceae bacterium]
MVFNSFHFLAFFIITVTIFFALPKRFKWMFLLAISYYFYMCWKPEFIILLVLTTLIDYSIARGIAAAKSSATRRLLLITSITISVSVLGTFKYLDFFSASLNSLFASFNIFLNVPTFHLLLPVGISFYTFQSLAYIVDVYRGTISPERHLGIFALFVVFFPQLVAGPINRTGHLLPQFYQSHPLTFDRLRSGLQLALWGIFKKMAVADLVAPFVESVYHNPHGQSGGVLLVATLFFTVQIYCDFSGYSDVAIGIARIMGFDLMTNFRQPYFATSMADFWRRWHISLSTWFRDYVYFPLGGSRVPRMRRHFNVIAVFLISGLWHGANWTFVAWGFMHGLLLVIENATESVRAFLARTLGLTRLPRTYLLIKILFVFSIVLVTWVLFRARNFSDAAYIIAHLPRLRGFRPGQLISHGLPIFEFALACTLIFALFAVEACLVFQPRLVTSLWSRRPVRWTAYSLCVYSVIFFGVFERVQFIYFQF